MLIGQLIASMRAIAAARLAPVAQPLNPAAASFWLGQHTNPEKNAARKARKIIGARQQRIRRKGLNHLLKAIRG